ncbi:TonB family protein [Gallaecimonas kandeliae]|uniref:TonB family protein n=1 Tax=Gallaecimonas kandeliae TaxID=3029055 RepID=UPI00264A2A1E|nr:TonB family protein [Gallaecimonas kandeliae]WKE65822.1 TonB family protein [Gallaecimonas kandeliae]
MRRWLLSTSLLLAASPAFADFNDGLKAYLAKDYPKALAEFQAAAQLGHPNAQFDLGAMYFNGEGMSKNLVEAYAWFSVAADNGFAGADNAKTQVLERLTQPQRQAALDLAHHRLAKAGHQALVQSLLPEIRITTDAPDAKPVARVDPIYPISAARKGLMGFNKVIFDINEAGGVENARVFEAVPQGLFEEATLKAIRQWRYAPPKDKDGKPSRIQGTTVSLDYELAGYGINDQSFEKLTQPLEQKANAGDPAAQFQLAGVLEWQNSIDGWRSAQTQGEEHYGATALLPYSRRLARPQGIPKVSSHYFKTLSWIFAFRLDKEGVPQDLRLVTGPGEEKKDAQQASWTTALTAQITKRHYRFKHPNDGQGLYVLKYQVFNNSDEEESTLPALAPKLSAKEMMVKAAQGGLALAQYQVGSDLLYGRSCVVDRRKGLDWLTYAAQQGQVEAQELLGMELVKGGETERDWAKAKVWLEKAAAQGSWLAKRELARVLATADAASLRDPDRALALAQEVIKDHEDPNSYGVLADAWQAKGDKKKARHYLKEALDEADDRGWDIGPYQARLKSL